MKHVRGAVILWCGLCGAVRAGYVDLDLTVNIAANTWQVYAQVQGGALGLDGFSFDVLGSGGAAVTSSLNRAPLGSDGPAAWGFDAFRSDGTRGTAIMAAQSSIYAPLNDPALDALVLRNVGILAGSRASGAQSISWNAKVLLASGTYSGSVGTLSVAPRTGESWSLLSDLGGDWNGPGHLQSASDIHGDSANVGPSAWQGGAASSAADWGLPANWLPGTAAPDGPGAAVSFGNQLPANSVVDMISAGRTVGGMTFSATVGTTIHSTGHHSLTLDNASGVCALDVTGSHVIGATLLLDSDAEVTGGGTLALSGDVSGPHCLALSAGTLVLSGSNRYEGGTVVSGGTLLIQSADALPPDGRLIVMGGGMVVFSSEPGAERAAAAPAGAAAVPEPAALVLLAAAAFALALPVLLTLRVRASVMTSSPT